MSSARCAQRHAVYPPITLTVQETERVVESTALIARLVSAVGLINIQFVIRDGIPHVLEVNPRASRTVPFLSKVTGVPMVALATHAALGRSLVEQGFSLRAGENPLCRLACYRENKRAASQWAILGFGSFRWLD